MSKTGSPSTFGSVPIPDLLGEEPLAGIVLTDRTLLNSDRFPDENCRFRERASATGSRGAGNGVSRQGDF
jgi:hypothetical protein